jgi:benzoyl-CoA reductase/2-hydroxyglutaryl-CoA dehydratase subunit BcrC/BadD/HgdB
MQAPDAHAEPTGDSLSPVAWFSSMIDHCRDHVQAARTAGSPVVGIMCEFTPREIVLAAGAVPVCLCGGSASTIPAAEQHLPTNLCPLIKSTFGYCVTHQNPFFEWADVIVAETTCDGKKKMFELMAAHKPMHVLELPQKSDDPDGFFHWVQELQKLRFFLEDRFEVRITEDKLREAIRLMNRERGLRRGLADLMQRDPPPLTGRQLLGLNSLISGIEADLGQYERALEVYGSDGVGDGAARRPRVLLTGVPVVHGAERIVELVESSGAVVVCLENCTGLKPLLDDVDSDVADPIIALAHKYYHLPCSVMTPNQRRLDTLRELVRKYRPHCVIDLVWQACLTYDVESDRIRKLFEDELGLPYLKIETDYSPGDSARIRVRVQALLEAGARA